MRRASAMLACLAMAAPVAACGAETPRERVGDYLEQVNGVQDRSAKAFDRANRAYIAFSRGGRAEGGLVKELERAEAAIRATRGRLVELEPPLEAVELHRRLVRFYGLNVGFADETARLARYLPAAARALRPLERTNRRLDGALESRDPKAQASALERYSEKLDGVVRDLRRLDPPPVLERTHAAQLSRYRKVQQLAHELPEVIKKRDTRATAKRLVEFRRAQGQGRGDPLIERSIRDYARRYLALRRSEVAVRAARADLEGRLSGR